MEHAADTIAALRLLLDKHVKMLGMEEFGSHADRSN